MWRCALCGGASCSARFHQVGLALLLAVLLGAGSRPAVAQNAIQAALERQGPTSPNTRAQLYRELRNQADFLEKTSSVVKTVAKLIGPTVVHVRAEMPQRATMQRVGGQQQVEEDGSGVIIEYRGKLYILTNRHVVSGARPESIHLTLADGRNIHPGKVWEDPETDVAVLSVAATDLVAASVGDSSKMEIGDLVLAVGSPFGLSHSVTFGIVSAKGRRDLNLPQSGVRIQDFLQTDAAINPGNSGGPLVNLRGEVIGINTAIASNSGGSEGIGFAIPSNMFMIVARQLIDQGKVSRAFLGVQLDPKFSPEVAAELGLSRPIGTRITQITPNSPAEAARLQKNDVILQFDGVVVEGDAHLINLVSLTEIGKRVSLVIFRDRATMTLEIPVDDHSKF